MDRVADAFDSPDLTAPLPGRQREQQELRSLLDRALRGYGGVVLISGEAGIGKTTLADRLAMQARGAGASVHTGHCYVLTAGQPYTPWIELRQSSQLAEPDLPLPALSRIIDGAAGPGSKIELFEQVSSTLRDLASSRPLVLIVEDLHWADSASLELLRHVARQASGLALLIVATYREDEPDSGNGLFEALPDLIRESRAHRLDLRRLSLEDVQLFVHQLRQPDQTVAEDLARYLHRRAEGNPFFMTELLRDVSPDNQTSPEANALSADSLQSLPIPSLVRQVIENRVQRLSDRTRALLNIAAVIGHDAPVDLWRQTANVDDAELARAIEESIAAHLLRESGDGSSVRFVHGLIQETLYLGQIALRRRAIHRAVAGVLADASDPSPDALAHHLDRAGDEQAIDWLVRAAGRAQEIYAARDAVRYITRAEGLAQQFGAALPNDAYRVRALAREIQGEIDLARQDYERLLQSARAAGDRTLECQALIDLGLLWAGQDYQQCGEHLTQALSIAEHLGDARVHAQCLNRVANWRANTGHLASAIDLHQDALRMFEAAGDAGGIADTLDLLGSTSYLAGDYPASVDYFDRAIHRSRGLNDRVRLASSLANLAIIGGDFDVSFDAGLAATRSPEIWISYGEEAVRITREIGWKSGESFALAMLGSAIALRGDLGRGLELLEQSHEIAHRFGHQQWLTASSLILGSLWAELLDPSRTELHLERARAGAAAVGSHLWLVLAESSLAALWADCGDASSAMALLDHRRKAIVEPGRSHTSRVFQFAIGRVNLAAGEPETALTTAEALLALEAAPSEAGGIPQILKLKADALAALGRPDEADATYQRAARSAELLDYRTIRWRVLADWSVIATGLRRRELRSEADALVATIARSIADPDTRNRFRRHASDLIHQSGRQGAPHRDSSGLSSRQREVLALVATGLTDAQVAERLFISPRTVARHLQAIYTNLGVNSRTAAVALAFERHLIEPGRSAPDSGRQP